MTPDPNDDLRDELHRRAASVTPKGSYADIERKLTADAHRRPWDNPALVAIAAVLALLVGAGVAAFLVRDGDQGSVRTIDDRTATTAAATSTTVTPAPEPTAAPETTPPPPPTTAARPPTTPPPTTSAPPPATTEVPTTTAPTTTTTTSAPTTTAAPTTTTTQPPSPPASPITTTSRVGLDGIGAVSLPVTRDDFETATGQRLKAPTDEIPGSPCDFTSIIGGPADLSMMTDGDRLVRVDVANPSLRTRAGVGVGSTRQQVRAAYPGAVDHTSVYGQPELIVTDPGHPGYKLNFAILDDKVTDYRAGVSRFVDYPEGCS